MKAYKHNKFIQCYQCQNGYVPLRRCKDGDLLITLYHINDLIIALPAPSPTVRPIRSTATGYSFIYYSSQWNSRLMYENLWKWKLQGS